MTTSPQDSMERERGYLPVEGAAGSVHERAGSGANAANHLLSLFSASGGFEGRDAVAADDTMVQALPVVIVRNKSGQVLRLRRREQRPDNPLHEKLVIWAGGHVCREDGANGNSIIQCAVRELQEEPRLNIEPKDLRLLGAVRALSAGRTQQHVAIVFEWRAATADVAVALSNAEFFERRGTSLSGTFVSIDDLAQDVDRGKVSEPWSVEGVPHLLPDVNGKLEPPDVI